MICKKLLYCALWSVGLFFATFYGLFSCEGEAFDFTGKLLLPIAESHIFPMIMAMTLYLLDVIYNVSLRKGNDRTIGILVMIMIFMVAFVCSILVNCNVIGWALFVASWMALTVLKYQTTDDEQVEPYAISDN